MDGEVDGAQPQLILLQCNCSLGNNGEEEVKMSKSHRQGYLLRRLGLLYMIWNLNNMAAETRPTQ